MKRLALLLALLLLLTACGVPAGEETNGGGIGDGELNGGITDNNGAGDTTGGDTDNNSAGDSTGTGGNETTGDSTNNTGSGEGQQGTVQDGTQDTNQGGSQNTAPVYPAGLSPDPGATDGGTSGENMIWFFKDGTLTLRGTGELMDDPRGSDYIFGPWRHLRLQVTKLVVEEGVTRLDAQIFAGYTELREVILPSSLQTIDTACFSRCTKLERVQFSEGLVEMGEFVFYQCSALQELTLPNSLKTLGSNAFTQSGLQKVTLGSGLQQIGSTAFRDCKSLTDVVFTGDNLSGFEFGLFMDCSHLQRVRMPKELSVYNDKAFNGCPDNVTLEYVDGPLLQVLVKLNPHRNWVMVE